MLPIAAGDAMRACAIQAMSSMAWSRVWRGDVGGPGGVGPEQRVERGHEAIVCGRWDIRGQVFEQDRPSGHGWSGLAGVARFLVRAYRARAVPQAPTSVLLAEPGVRMVLEINTSQC